MFFTTGDACAVQKKKENSSANGEVATLCRKFMGKKKNEEKEKLICGQDFVPVYN